jgi:phosphatidylglycerophosphatase A
MKNQDSPMPLPRRLALFYASGLGTGRFPVSGTVATAAAIPVYFAILHWFNRPDAWIVLYIAIVAALFVAGVKSASLAEEVLGEKDPHLVTIDEFVGYFVCLTLVPITWQSIAASFVLFRIFDILKPPPIRRLESIRGGFGIMIDDVLAGLYAWAFLQVIFRWVLSS